MKANDLMIGNIILNCANGPIEILNGEDVSIICDNIHKYKPIPLTEEWLLKFGFEKGFNEEPSIREKGWFNDYIFIGNDLYFNHYEGSVKIKYVHQLQNLYYCLTGEQLTIE